MDLSNDIIKLRSHFAKHFKNLAENEYTCIQGFGLMHYHDGSDFKDIESLPFPDGKEIKSDADLTMVKIPDWGRAEVEENGKVVRIYDKLDKSIYIFHSPVICEKDKLPYILTNKKIAGEVATEKSITTKEELITALKTNDYETKTLNTIATTEVEYVIKDNNICFKLPDGVKAENLTAWDDTDATGGMTKTGTLAGNAHDYHYAYPTIQLNYGAANNPDRSLFYFTLVAGTGTITKVDFVLKVSENSDAKTISSKDADLCILGTSAWTEAGCTFHKYDGTNTWSTAGGDYSTVIDTAAPSANDDSYTPIKWTIYGTGATNPQSVTWGSTLNTLLKYQNETGTLTDDPNMFFCGRNYAVSTRGPYIEITYGSTGSANPHQLGTTGVGS